MLRDKIDILINDFGVKKNALIETMSSNRVDFGKKYASNSFTDQDRMLILKKYGKLLT